MYEQLLRKSYIYRGTKCFEKTKTTQFLDKGNYMFLGEAGKGSAFRQELNIEFFF